MYFMKAKNKVHVSHPKAGTFDIYTKAFEKENNNLGNYYEDNFYILVPP